MELTHLDDKDKPKMVDVGGKKPTKRVAVASGEIKMSPAAFTKVKQKDTAKGSVIHTAVVAAIMGAKKTHELIPMCHPLLINSINVDIEELISTNSFKLVVKVSLDGQTGVEMEALTGVSIGLLTIYDMVKAIDKSMIIHDIKLISKSGGKSGDYLRH